MSELRARGIFWWHDATLPENVLAPSEHVAGELLITENGRILLSLDGYLDRGKGPFSVLPDLDTNIDECVEGRLIAENKQVYLVGVSKSGSAVLRLGGVSTEALSAQFCLISEGTKATTVIPDKFSLLRIDLTAFSGWLRFSQFNISLNDKPTDGLARIFTKSTPKVEYRNAYGKLDIDLPIGSLSMPQFELEVMLRIFCIMTYTPACELKIDSMRIEFGHIQDLLIILTDSEYCLPWPLIGAHVDAETKYFRFYFPRYYTESRSPDWYSCPTNFQRLRSDFGTIHERWKILREKFGPGCYMYLSTRRGMAMYSESVFTSLIVGLESFHGTKYPTSASKDFRDKIARILKPLNNSDRRWLKNRLKRAYEPSLEKRLLILIESFSLNLNRKNISAFAKACRERRNDLSHYGGARDETPYESFSREITEKGHVVGIIYHVLLMKEIGIDEQTLYDWIWKGPKSHLHKTLFQRTGLLETSEAV